MMIVREVQAKTILSVSKIHDYVVNPYTGCQHACSYCYASFMKRFTGHQEPWGEFVDAKINAPELLSKEILKKKVGTVWVSGVCDPYQPLPPPMTASGNYSNRMRRRLRTESPRWIPCTKPESGLTP
jgi:DNA repair photolyase